jgi:hypothetical protein
VLLKTFADLNFWTQIFNTIFRQCSDLAIAWLAIAWDTYPNMLTHPCRNTLETWFCLLSPDLSPLRYYQRQNLSYLALDATYATLHLAARISPAHCNNGLADDASWNNPPSLFYQASKKCRIAPVELYPRATQIKYPSILCILGGLCSQLPFLLLNYLSGLECVVGGDPSHAWCVTYAQLLWHLEIMLSFWLPLPMT